MAELKSAPHQLLDGDCAAAAGAHSFQSFCGEVDEKRGATFSTDDAYNYLEFAASLQGECSPIYKTSSTSDEDITPEIFGNTRLALTLR